MTKNIGAGVALLGMLLSVAVVSPAAASHRDSPPTCSCSASLSVARPSLQFSGGTLQFIPHVNVSIRTRGSSDAPRITSTLQYNGDTSYASDDVSVPSGVSFSGERNIVNNVSCGSRYTFRGLALPAVSLTGLTSSLVGDEQELDGTVRLHASLVGCGFEEEHRQTSFTLSEFGNLRVRGWRSIR